jgi:hypothetical protein
VQVSHDDRHPAQVVRVAEHLVVGGFRLVGRQHAGLHRRVPRLYYMARPWRFFGQPVRHGDHQGITSGTEPEFHGGNVKQYPVAKLGTAGQRRVGQRPYRPATNGDFQLNRALPFAAQTDHHSVPPSNHPGRVT